MQRLRGRLKKGLTLTLTAVMIGSGINIMTTPVHAENETVSTPEKKEQVDFHFPKSEVNVVENDPDFTMAAEGAAEGSVVTYTIEPSWVATVDNNGTVHLKQEGLAVVTAVASETDEYKSKEISYTLNAKGAPAQDAIGAITDENDTNCNPAPDNWDLVIDEIAPDDLFEKPNQIEVVGTWDLVVKDDSDLPTYTLDVKIPEKVPEEMLEIVDSLDAMKELMTDKMHEVVAYADFVAEPVVYDVKLMSSDENGNLVAVTPENFPEKGIEITVPYPNGTDKDNFIFTVCHLFTHAANGHVPGETECPTVTKGENGISFTVTGLSPISIGWIEAKSEPGKGSGGAGAGSSTSNKGNNPSGTTQNDSNANTNKTDTEGQINANNSGSANQTVTNTPSASSSRSPKTADNNLITLYLILMLCSISGLAAVRKYKYNN